MEEFNIKNYNISLLKTLLEGSTTVVRRKHKSSTNIFWKYPIIMVSNYALDHLSVEEAFLNRVIEIEAENIYYTEPFRDLTDTFPAVIDNISIFRIVNINSFFPNIIINF